MELDVETLDGHWSTNHKTGMDFFIINDAIFSKLCILGDEVEPCFEGARVTAPEVSTSFTKIDDDFKKTLYTMMQDLKFALEGGKNMDMEQNLVVEETIEEVVAENNEEVVETVETEETPATEFDSLARNEEPVVETPVVEEPVVEEVVETEEVTEEPAVEEEVVEEVEAEESSEVEVEEVVEETIVEEENLENDDNSEQSIINENEECIEATLSSQENFAKSDDEEKDEDKDTDEEESNDDNNDTDEDNDDKDDEDEKKKYSLLEESYNTLQAEYAELNSKYEALVEFKNQVENEKKDALINSFYMLSDEDKQEVIENKANYSLDDIEAKLSVICVRKKVNFDLDDTSKNDNIVEEEKDVMTYNLSGNDTASTPAWIAALKNTRDSKK